MRKLFVAAASASLLLGGATQAMAISDHGESKIPGTGAIVQANAWHCNVYADKCSFKTSSKALKGGAHYKVDKIKNVATVKANGWNATISLSPSGTYVSENTRQIAWTNTKTWVADVSGIADPGGAFNTSITTCSDASAFKSGSKGFASACAND
ncbi:hypothetical protein [Streptomyces sp. XD-27]|uniref:hypothetical protein n=1 Tax=Streptomyces sp. XD-27 TaxID=3062779 RepID=UPI0026F4354A|nr:hypothetical protein [Streptomyces sp. XD-27]WKX71954.1 hypothetical protein Q3Y56_20460 [Streptomyces sp. XD-27]